MISFSFDDAPASATQTGARILEERGMRGSYYIAAALAGTDAPTGRMADRDDVARLAEAGHEIGCHTYTHLDCGQACVASAVEDVALNAQTLAAWGLPQPTTFAYPYGDVAPATKKVLAGRFSLLRALHPGLVTAGTDLNQAPSVPVDAASDEVNALAWINRAAGRKAWLIFCLHDVAQRPSEWGCTPHTLALLADAALTAGFEAVTVAEGARRLAD